MNRTLIAALVFVGGLTSASPALAASRDAAALKRALGAGVRVAEHEATGKVRFVGTAAGKPIARARGLSRSVSPSRSARAFLGRYGAAFGIRDQARELRVTATEAGTAGRSAVRFQQLLAGVPVMGGELVVNLDAARNVLSASGEALPAAKVATSARVGSAAAQKAAVAAVAKTHPKVGLKATAPSLWIYDSRILGGPGLERPTLTWRLDVKDDGGAIDELVLVDAASGSVALRISHIHNALNRIVCDANNTTSNVPCTAPVRTENGDAGPPHALADVNNAYNFAGDTYDFFLGLGRDSVDGQGKQLKSTVRYCDATQPCPYANAFWNGDAMVYGQGYASADDVVGHELTHGVTDFSAHLFYYYQSGAINESMSDVFGEFVDLQQNVTPSDNAAVRWKIGEDLSIGAIRDMEDPTFFGDPDRMTSPNYISDPDESLNHDSGGVHTNSGVNNKAAFLMTDGGAFNNRTVAPVGIPKVSRIYYTVLTSMLTSASDYADLGSALSQACTNLVGTSGITAGDCTQVNEAVAATEMSIVPPAAPTPLAPVCPSGLVATDLFSDDIENAGSGKWTTQSPWFYPENPNTVPFDAEYATSGTNNIWGYNKATVGDYSITMNSNVAIPAGSTAYLRFNHAYGFEDDGLGAYDGGMLEVSVNGGAFADAGSLLTEGGYNGTLTTSSNNPLEGRSAFVRDSNGYGSSRATLSSLAGQQVRFRFRIGTDGSLDDFGWFIDDVRLYTCAAPPPPPPPPPPPVVVVTPPVVTGPTLGDAKVKSCRRTGRARRTRVICSLTGFGAVSRASLKVTRRGRTVASGSAKPSKAGTLTIKGKRTLARGSYRVTLTLRDASGKTRRLTKTMRVR